MEVKESKFKIGDPVRVRFDSEVKGEVVRIYSVPHYNAIFSVFESKGKEQHYNENDLVLDDPDLDAEVAKKVSKALKNAARAFEKAFEEYARARELADERSSIYDLEDAGLVSRKELFNVIESHGWQASSLDC